MDSLVSFSIDCMENINNDYSKNKKTITFSYCFKSLIKMIMNYIYFPSPVVYFFIVLFMLIACIRTLFSDISIINTNVTLINIYG